MQGARRQGGWTAGVVLALAASAMAQAAAPGGNGVARLSWRAGEVSVQRGAAGGQAAETAAWTPGGVNTPLLAGDRVATAAGARAEIALDYADFLRLDGDAQATLLTLRWDDLQASVEHGLADFAVLRGARASAEIDTPLAAVRPRGEGVFRIEVNSDDQTVITVRSGAADVATAHGSAVVRAGETMTVVGANDPQYQIVDAAPADGWDAWNAARDRRIVAGSSRLAALLSQRR